MRTLLLYVLTLLTGGHFALVWIFLMMYEVQKKGGNLARNLGLYAAIFFAAYFIYIVTVGYGVYRFIYGEILPEKYFFYLVPVAVFILIGFGSLLFTIANFIRSKSVRIPNNLVLCLLLFAYLSTLPLLQVKLNKIDGAS